MPIRAVNDKYISPAKYRVIVSDIGEVRCSKISGLECATEFAEYYEGGNPNPAAQLPTTNTWPNLVIERGRTPNHNLHDWWVLCSSGRAKAEDMEHEVTVETLDLDGVTVLYADTFHRVKVAGYKESDKETKPGDVVIETLTLKHAGKDLTKR